MSDVMETVEKQKGLLRRGVHASEIRMQRTDEDDVLTFPASSEEPVERWYGTEVLSHDAGAVKLDRAKGGAMPLLFNHDVNDPVGMITGARVESNRLVVDAKLFRTARAAEVKAMIDGGLRNVSLAYRVHVIEEHKKTETYTATEWEPYEVSIVTVPADPTVGIGRGMEIEYEVRMVRASSPAISAATREGTMPEGTPAAPVAPAAPNVTVIESRRAEDVQQMEKNRVRGIENLCKLNQLDDKYKDYWVRSGMSLDQVSDDMLRIMEERGKSHPQSVSRIGLTDRETQQFSLCRAINACSTNDWNLAPFELECSRAIAKAANRMPDPKKFFIPYEVQARANQSPLESLAAALLKRDLTVGVAGSGGYMVGTQNVSFIELLRNRSVVFNMGAQRLSGLRDNVTIPKQSATGSTTWLSTEAAQLSEVNQTFVQIALTPKTVGGYTEISRQLLLQSNPSIEGIVSSDLASIVALDIDLKALNGSGAAGQPTGILNTAGIGSVTGTSLDYADIVEFQTDVFAGNALSGASGYVTTGAVAGLLKTRVKFTSTASPIWEGRLEEGMVDGYRGMASNQMPTATMLFGDFSKLIIAEWGVLEIEANPYADFKAGIVGVRAIASIDIGVRYPTAFSAANTIT